jgi:hypothetical protein
VNNERILKIRYDGYFDDWHHYLSEKTLDEIDLPAVPQSFQKWISVQWLPAYGKMSTNIATTKLNRWGTPMVEISLSFRGKNYIVESYSLYEAEREIELFIEVVKEMLVAHPHLK